MKIYTKRGDKGETSLYGGTRVPKDHIRIEAYGTVDELNAHIGVCMSYMADDKEIVFWRGVQSRLFDIGANLAEDGKKPQIYLPEVNTEHLQDLEQAIDRIGANLVPLKKFILPSGHIAVSYCHVARTVCRRAERTLVRLSHEESINPILIQYLNRLSDLLFIYAREFGRRFDVEEIKWIS